jgi:hypothetical protein
MNIVMIIPTGIGCEIGGHAGDATPAAKLLGMCCDKLILHPNVVNASDINEMPPNALYVEGGILDRFLEGQVDLCEVSQNRILLAVNAPVRNETINAASAARTTIGADIRIIELKTPLRMRATLEGDRASGVVNGWRELVDQVREYDFDALAISTPIDCEKDRALQYFRVGGVNPWGAVEAIGSRLISDCLNRPVAHAPVESDDAEMKTFNEVVDSRMAAEVVSTAYLHCVLKGLHSAPQIGKGLSVNDVDCLVSPYGCSGRPHIACIQSRIPIIFVRENSTVLNNPTPTESIVAENYLEAAGLLMAMRAGISPESVRRPIKSTTIYSQEMNDGSNSKTDQRQDNTHRSRGGPDSGDTAGP